MGLVSDVLIGQGLMGQRIEFVDMIHVHRIKSKLLPAGAKHVNQDLPLKQQIPISKDNAWILVRTIDTWW